MNDFTLIIPTYNRPVELARLLAYLAASGATFAVAVLDSSEAAVAAGNRDMVARSPLQVRYHAFDPRTEPFDKFAQGAAGVETAFAAMCPDDDIPFISGLAACLDQLRREPGYSMSQGWYFLFAGGEGGADPVTIHTLLYHAASYVDADPLRRLHALARRYQALTYGIYRTAVLQEALERSRRMGSLLWREHLGSALAVVHGKVGRVESFYMGRRAGGHAPRRHWHPVEWMIADPQGLAAGFAAFATELAAALVAVAPGARPKAEVLDLVHLIYADYLVQHLPQEIFDPIVEQRLQGVPPDRVFASSSIAMPVIAASQRFLEELAPDTQWPAEIHLRSRVRDYRFGPAFLRMLDRVAATRRDALMRGLVIDLDRWVAPASGSPGGGAAAGSVDGQGRGV